MNVNQSANVDAKAMRLLSQFGNDVVASMSLAGQYHLKDLAYAAVLVSDHFYQQQQSDPTQPFTVEWLCEIGGEQFASGIVFFKSPHGVEFDYWGYQKKWTLDGSTVKTPITTRGDVLAWLNVLGIEVNQARTARNIG